MPSAWESLTVKTNGQTFTHGNINDMRQAGIDDYNAGIGGTRPGFVSNIGFSYSGGTFTVHDAEGDALASDNKGYVSLWTKGSPGKLTRYDVTANQTFIDDAGSSEIVNNLFGFTTSVAITNDVPFFLYAVGNDDQDTIAFMISRYPGAWRSPAEANIGAPDDAVADTQGSFFSLENITESEYDQNPCLCIGCFRMKMSASDDWTVQAIDYQDGLGKFFENYEFTMPLGQNGADASAYCFANAGTAPVFSNNNYSYFVYRNGSCRVNISLTGDGGTDGGSAVASKVVLPYKANNVSTATSISHGVVRIVNPTLSRLCCANLDNAQSYFTLEESDSLNSSQWADFSNGTRQITGSFEFLIDNA